MGVHPHVSGRLAITADSRIAEQFGGAAVLPASRRLVLHRVRRFGLSAYYPPSYERGSPSGDGQRAGQALPEVAGQRRRRDLVRGRARRGVRTARTERRRQDDDRRHADHERAPDQRHGERRRDRRRIATRCRRAPGSRSCRSAATSIARSRSAATSRSTPPTTASRRPKRRPRADRVLEQFGLRERGDVKPDLFSGGQAQRVMIARALMHEPQVLFLDEPTTGLDPAARLFVWDRLRELRDRGVTLILTTHDMHEAATLADRVGIMDHGKLLALDTPEALIRSLPGSSTLELVTQAPDGDSARATARRVGRAARGRARRVGARAEPRTAERRTLRLRLYVVRRGAGARRAGGLAARGARAVAGRRRARRALARGRLHPPHRTDAAMSALAATPAIATQGRVFRAVLRRDLFVTWKELPVFLAQVILQPLFLLFVFGKVLGSLGYTQNGYTRPAVPGPARADRRDHRHADARVPARGRVRLDEGDRGPAARADGDRARRRREGPVREPARDRRHSADDPGRDPRARLDPVALERACRC